MPRIPITIANKIAHSPRDYIVCGNSDYEIEFNFDSEWADYDTKTARFYNGHTGTFEDVVFVGNICPVPVLSDVAVCKVGVYAGDLHTTTSALIKCERSILCEGGAPAAPSDDVYAQIMELLNKASSEEQIAAAVEAYMAEHPLDSGINFTTGPNLSLENGVLSVNTASAVEADNTLPITSAAVHSTVGNIEALLETI